MKKTTTIQIRVQPELKDEILKAVDRLNISISDFGRMAFIEKLIRIKEKKGE